MKTEATQMNETRITVTVILDPAWFRPALPKPIFPVNKKRRILPKDHTLSRATVPFGQGR